MGAMLPLAPTNSVTIRPLLLGLALVLLGSCQTAPERTIPDPLPETLEWAIPASTDAAFLGLEVRENDSGSLESLSFAPGVRVHALVERSPAEQAGIQVDDVLLSMNGVEVAVPEDLEQILMETEGGTLASLAIQRGDTVFDVNVNLGGASSEEAPAASVREAFVLDPARTSAAWGSGGGAVLVSFAKKSPVRGLGLGARVTEVNGDPVKSGRGLVRRLLGMDPGTAVQMTVEAEDGSRTERRVKLLGEGRRTTRFSIPVLTTYDATADRERTSFVLLDLYLISLFRYERDGGEKRWSFLRFFQWSTGIGELDQ